jgi:isocitrate lyase
MKEGLAGKIAKSFISSKLTVLLMIVFMVVGVYSSFLIPREEEPQIDVPMADIFVGYPGASPTEVESRVTKPLEKIIANIKGVEYVYSTSMKEQGMLIVQFYVGEDMERSYVKLYNELMKNMVRAGASGVHFEDQLASVKKCGHMGGKVLVPTQEAVQKLSAARLAADVEGVPTILLARTDANAADLITSDCDPYDAPFIVGGRTAEGFYRVKAGIDQAISRGLAYAPYADLLWCETAKPDLDEARKFAEAIRKEFPDQLLAYNCSPSFNWRKNLDDATIARFQTELSAMGYKFQFITLAGIHNMWHGMFNLAHAYARNDMSAYVELQEQEFRDASKGYTFVAHQQEVGTGYFDDMTTVIQGSTSSVTALTGSTEEEQFASVS